MASFRRAGSALMALAPPLLLGWIGRAGADHGGLAPIVKLSPLITGIIAGVLALAAGIAIVAIVMLLMKKRPSE